MAKIRATLQEQANTFIENMVKTIISGKGVWDEAEQTLTLPFVMKQEDLIALGDGNSKRDKAVAFGNRVAAAFNAAIPQVVSEANIHTLQTPLKRYVAGKNRAMQEILRIYQEENSDYVFHKDDLARLEKDIKKLDSLGIFSGMRLKVENPKEGSPVMIVHMPGVKVFTESEKELLQLARQSLIEVTQNQLGKLNAPVPHRR